MTKIFKKENIMPVAVLAAICIVVAALLALVNSFTAKEIERQRLEAANAGSLEVLPELDVTTKQEIKVDAEKYPKEVKAVSKFDAGYVIETEVKGNASGMVVLVGIDNEGKVTGVKVIKNGETPSYWASVEPEVTGKDGKYNGMTAETLEAQLVSGATNSSKGVYNAVKTALDAFTVAGGGTVELPPEYTPPVCHLDEAELLALMGELVADNAGFTEIEFDAKGYNAQYLAKIFKENGTKGYVAYVASISSYYGTVDTENLIHIDNTGKIKNIKKLTWAVSDAVPEYGYNPPNDEKLAELYASLNGKDSSSIGDVDIHTGATNTTTTLVASITEALKVVGDIIKKDMPTPEEEVKALAAELMGLESADFIDETPDERTYVKKLYKVSGYGYIAYVSSISSKYGSVDTENIIYIGSDGSVKGIKKLTWSISDAVPEWGYNPPNDERVNELYEELNGKNSSSIGDVDLTTGATNTTTVLVNSIKEALKAAEALIKKEMTLTDDEVKALAGELINDKNSEGFTDVTPENTTYLKKLYKHNGTKGYVAYVIVMSESYAGQIESAALIHIDVNGKIQKINKLACNISPSNPQWGYTAPTEEEVEAFYDRLNKIDAGSIGGVELITNATNTSTNVVKSIKEALDAAGDLIRSYMPTSADEIKAYAEERFGTNFEFTDLNYIGAPTVRKLWKDNDGNGYVAYLVAMSTSYKDTVETETLVFIDEDGRIVGIEKLIWKTSDAGFGYVPPLEADVEAFYAKLKGHNLDEFGACFMSEDPIHVTNATSTTTRLVETIYSALAEVTRIINIEEPEESPDDVIENDSVLARVIGISAISAMVVAIAAYIAVPKIIRRRNEDE